MSATTLDRPVATLCASCGDPVMRVAGKLLDVEPVCAGLYTLTDGYPRRRRLREIATEQRLRDCTFGGGFDVHACAPEHWAQR